MAYRSTIVPRWIDDEERARDAHWYPAGCAIRKLTGRKIAHLAMEIWTVDSSLPGAAPFRDYSSSAYSWRCDSGRQADCFADSRHHLYRGKWARLAGQCIRELMLALRALYAAGQPSRPVLAPGFVGMPRVFSENLALSFQTPMNQSALDADAELAALSMLSSTSAGYLGTGLHELVPTKMNPWALDVLERFFGPSLTGGTIGLQYGDHMQKTSKLVCNWPKLGEARALLK